ncbi:unnamed protein product [Chrysoparadoxa australica]
MSVVRSVKLRVPAGTAKPGPAIGQALGPLGINMMEFCKAFNDKSTHFIQDTPIPVVLTAYSNRTFTFQMKTPLTVWLLCQAAGIKKGSDKPGLEIVGKVGTKAIYEIAKIKHTDEHIWHLPLEVGSSNPRPPHHKTMEVVALQSLRVLWQPLAFLYPSEPFLPFSIAKQKLWDACCAASLKLYPDQSSTYLALASLKCDLSYPSPPLLLLLLTLP